MIDTTIYNHDHKPSPEQKQQILAFLFQHLEQYGDALEDIEKAFAYAMKENDTDGGFITTATENGLMAGAAIINKTGMAGYIPENILVYIATHKDFRGKGVGTALMQEIIHHTEGNIALHVEPDNPAVHLYQKFGFTNKYLEMRLNKKELENGLHNA